MTEHVLFQIAESFGTSFFFTYSKTPVAIKLMQL